MTRRVVVGLGANLGSRLTTMRCALELLEARADLRVVATSRAFSTEPVGPPQPRYLNAAALVETNLPLRGLLDRALEVERALGRERRERWGARVLDIDLLYAGEESLEEEGLIVPHPRLIERSFALAPLLDVLPEAPDELRRALQLLGGAPRVWAPLALDPSDPPWRVTRRGLDVVAEAEAGDPADALAAALTGLGRHLSARGVVPEPSAPRSPPSVAHVGWCEEGADPGVALEVLADAVARGVAVRWVTLAPQAGGLAVRLVGSAAGAPGPRPRPSQTALEDSKERPTARVAVILADAGVESAK